MAGANLIRSQFKLKSEIFKKKYFPQKANIYI